VVLASGQVIKTRRRARKSSAGFDLTKLFIGAEGELYLSLQFKSIQKETQGTLGIVTEGEIVTAIVNELKK
jgi:FAD/FMN-containing dehydrogenase